MLNNKNSNTNHNTNHDDDIVNNLIKIIYKNDKGQTLKNAILEKSKCNIYKEIEKMKNNKTKKINLNNVNSNSNSNSKSNNKSNSNSNSNINSNSNSKSKSKSKSNSNSNDNNNKTKKLKNTKKLEDITKKCFTKKSKINKQPDIIISDTNKYNNKDNSFLIVITSNVFLSFNTKKQTIPNKKKHLTWVAIINDNKVIKNIIKHKLNKEKGLHNFMIRIYSFPKNNSEIINNIEQTVNTKKHILIKKLKKIKNLERIYTNNIIIIRKMNSSRSWWWEYNRFGHFNIFRGLKLLT